VVRDERLGEDLDRHVPVELGVARPVDFTHAAGAQRRYDAVGTEKRPTSQGVAHPLQSPFLAEGIVANPTSDNTFPRPLRPRQETR
jgi:hypothetical protein